MQVISIRCGMTKNLGNFESAKMEVEAAPSEGQTVAQLLAEIREAIDAQLGPMPVAEKSAKGGNGKAKAEAPLKKTPEQEAYATGVADGNAEAEANKPAEKPAKSSSKGSKKAERQAAVGKNGAADKKQPEKPPVNVNKPDAKKELQYALDSETLEELLDRFNTVRKLAADFGDSWEDACGKIAERYRKLNSLDANSETLDQLVKAFKAERQAIEKMKQSQPAVAA